MNRVRWILIAALAVLVPATVWAVRDAQRERAEALETARRTVEGGRDDALRRLGTRLEAARRALDAVPVGDAAAMRDALDRSGAFDATSIRSKEAGEPVAGTIFSGGGTVLVRLTRRAGAHDLAGEIDLSAWLEEAARGGLRACVTDAAGDIAAVRRTEGEDTALGAATELVAGKMGSRSPAAAAAILADEPRQGVVAGTTGRGEYQDRGGEDWIGAWGPIALGDERLGGLVLERTRDDALAELGIVRRWHVFAGLGILALVPLLIIELSRRWKTSKRLLRLYAYVLPHWRPILVVFIAMVTYAASEAGQIFLLSWLLDGVLLAGDASRAEAWNTLLQIGGALVVLVSVMAVAKYLREYLSAAVALRTITDLRCAIGAHLLTLSLGYFHRNRRSEVLTRLTSDVDQSRKALTLVFGDLVQQPLMLAAAVAAAFATNPQFAAVLFLGTPLIAYPLAKFGRRIQKYARRRQTKQANVTNVMLQMLAGIRVVKAFRMERHEAGRLRAASDDLLGKELKVARTAARSGTILELFNLLGSAGIIVVGGYMVLNHLFGITPKDLIVFAAILGKIYRPIKSITKTYNRAQDALPSVDRVFEVMDLHPEIHDREGAKPMARPRDAIRFEHVTFAYGEEPVLHDVSFEAPVGEVVGLVGATGAGKSTLCDLVARFYDPTEGRVTVDGVDLRDVTLASLQDSLAIVTQDPFLFNSSIRENIRYGRIDATDEEIEEAARAAFIHDEVLEQPNGYDTLVGDRGVQLSGGQRQRVTIARAILKNAPILILDEATSALDSRSEGEVQRALANLMSDRTTFVIAHRLSTIRDADQILVLERGRIVERGTHAELVETPGGVYRQYHELQVAAAAGHAE